MHSVFAAAAWDLNPTYLVMGMHARPLKAAPAGATVMAKITSHAVLTYG